jgi:hypothetical protein
VPFLFTIFVVTGPKTYDEIVRDIADMTTGERNYSSYYVSRNLNDKWNETVSVYEIGEFKEVFTMNVEALNLLSVYMEMNPSDVTAQNISSNSVMIKHFIAE